MDIFSNDIKVSVYNGKYDNKGVVLPLRTFLLSTRHKEQILSARQIADKKQRDAIKVTMPMAVVGGVCHGRRCADNTTPNGLIAIDIDGKDNPGIDDMEALKWELGRCAPQIAYCSLSFSGNGLFAIIPIKYPRYFTQHFEQLMIDFANVGIVLDKHCSDVSRTRFLSYDEHPYVNPDAIPYDRLHIEPKKPVTLHPISDNADSTERKVAECVRQIKATGCNLTADYRDWMHIGMALADGLGENGRQYYHAVSSMDSRYRETETDKKYDNFLLTTQSVHIGTFFKLCSDAGIRCVYQSKPEQAHRTNNPNVAYLCKSFNAEVVSVEVSEHPRQYPHIHFDPMEGIDDEPVDLSAEWDAVMSQPILSECPF